MKTVFGAILTLVFLGVAYSLNCYMCDKQPSNEYCQSPKPCDSSAKFCKTEITTTSGMSITKTCAVVCNMTAAGTPNSVSCCAEDLCNANGASGVTVSATLLSVAVGASVLLMLRAGL